MKEKEKMINLLSNCLWTNTPTVGIDFDVLIGELLEQAALPLELLSGKG